MVNRIGQAIGEIIGAVLMAVVIFIALWSIGAALGVVRLGYCMIAGC